MLNPRKASPALYELIGRQTRVTSGKQIGGRDTPDGAEEAAAAHGHHAPAPSTHGAPSPLHASRATHSTSAPPPRRYTAQDEADHERRAPAPLRVARPPVHAPAPPHSPPHPSTLHPLPRAHAEPESLEPAPAVALGPGRAVRVPTGYFLFGVAAVLAAAIGGYMFGFVQKGNEVDAAERLAVQRGGAILTEPLGDEPPAHKTSSAPKPSPKTPSGPTATDPKTKGTPTPPPVTPPKPASTAKPGVVVVGNGIADPRTKGVNYAVVASLGKDKAIELAEFLQAAGVESAVLSRDTGGYYPVVSLVGFAKDDFGSKAKQDHENRLRDLGKQYAKQGNGRKDFSDLYWWKFTG